MPRVALPAVLGAALVAAALAAPTAVARAQGAAAEPLPAWPAIAREARPWTRWWWQGSAVNPGDLTASLEAYAHVGLGGVEVTPIYGVRGQERAFVPFLSPDWMRLLGHTLREARRLDLGVDMAAGTGWPFGGPWVPADDAPRYVAPRTFTLRAGERLRDTVRLAQEPFVRSQAAGAARIDVARLVEPIAANPDLQALALDQVRFAKPLPLVALVAYPDSGRPVDLTARVAPDGTLDWTAPDAGAPWTLYALFQGWHGKQVERAAPGGEGNVIDHFDHRALERYLARFDDAFRAEKPTGLRAFFNDSYEVDDARGEADWTPRLLDEFRARRGYDLRERLPALFNRDTPERNARVRSDYRETISELLLDEFTRRWRGWARGKDAVVRNQAHGAPAHLLDLYAASDIPETEGSDILGIKLASSAAHVTGKRLTSAEAATWLNEHFVSTPADVRAAVDLFLLGGVNHVFYHGTAYSPASAPWPGWLFYAAVHFQPTNPWWEDFAALNAYVARAQSFLQAGTPANDVLLYHPIHDVFADTAGPLLQHFRQEGPRDGTALRATARRLHERGYAFDYVSDRQLVGIEARAGALVAAGGASYATVVLPPTRLVPAATLARLVALARAGATVVVEGKLPDDVPGLGGLDERRAELRKALDALRFESDSAPGVRVARVGRGAFLLGDDLDRLLARARVRREAMVDRGLHFVRRRHAGGVTYFVVNRGRDSVDAWVPLAARAASAALFDPMSEARGMARLRSAGDGATEVYLQLHPGESRVVQTWTEARRGRTYPYLAPAGDALEVAGPWAVRYLVGGPELPQSVRTAKLGSWTTFGDSADTRFSGTASYTATFAAPTAAADAWLLDLGQVCVTARVKLNDTDVGTLIGPHFRVVVDGALLRPSNTLEVSVSNTMANRIADMDRRGVPYRTFYNTNFPARLPENRGPDGLFDASKWTPRCSGLLGPVTLTPVRRG